MAIYIYIDLLTNKLYKYDNNAYVEITTSVSTNFENSGVSAGTVTINGTSSTIKVPTGDTSSTVAVGNHTHNTTIATDSGTSTVDMSANTTYKLTAGGTNVIFKTPIDTTYVFDGTYDASTNKAATVSTVTNAISELPEPMVFKGSLGAGGTITTLPTASSSNKGYVYKVITAGTYASQSAKVGDTFISDGLAWVLIPSGDEPSGTVTNVAVANGGGLTVSGSPITSSGTITVGHSNSVTAKTSSSVKKFTYDAHGHITGSSELSTAESNALASGIDSTKVEQIETNKSNILTIANQSTRYNVLNLSAAENVTASSGITYSILSDGSVHIEADINVTGSALYFEKIPITSNITYITTGCPSGGGNTTYKVQIYDNETNIANADDTGSGSEPFTITTGKIGYRIRFAVGQYNIVVKPMVISKSLYDSGFTDYQPYALSNAELTAKEQANENNILLLNQYSGGFNKLRNTAVSTGIFTVNEDGSVTISGSTGSSHAVLQLGTFTGYANQWYLGGISGGSSTTYYIDVLDGVHQKQAHSGYVLIPFDYTNANVRIVVTPNQTVNTTIYPMIISADDYTINPNPHYQPYALSNAELTVKEQANESNISFNTNNGVKNVVPLKSSVNTGNADITFVQNANKSYTLSISATTSAAVAFDISDTFTLDSAMQYVLSGNPSSSAVRLVFAEGIAPFSWIDQQYSDNPKTITPVADKVYKLLVYIYMQILPPRH